MDTELDFLFWIYLVYNMVITDISIIDAFPVPVQSMCGDFEDVLTLQ